jgi:putative cell wall-binding protein
VEVSQAGWPDGADTVLLARGDNFPDSLAGVSLAYQLNAPILLTPTASLNSATKQEIERLGASRVIILGGTGAVSEAVETELLAMATVDTVDRLGGANRYETAKLIAEELDKGASFDTAFLASGLGFPDALAAASYGAMKGYPILLTGRDSLPAATKAALDSLSGIQKVVIVGGEAVISSAVEAELVGPGAAGPADYGGKPLRDGRRTGQGVPAGGVEGSLHRHGPELPRCPGGGSAGGQTGQRGPAGPGGPGSAFPKALKPSSLRGLSPGPPSWGAPRR